MALSKFLQDYTKGMSDPERTEFLRQLNDNKAALAANEKARQPWEAWVGAVRIGRYRTPGAAKRACDRKRGARGTRWIKHTVSGRRQHRHNGHWYPTQPRPHGGAGDDEAT